MIVPRSPRAEATPATSEASDRPKPPTAEGAAETLLEYIDRMRAEKNSARDRKKEVAKNLKNAERRKARLKRKARQLNDEDLIAVLQMRRDGPNVRAGSSQDPVTATRAKARTGKGKGKAKKG